MGLLESCGPRSSDRGLDRQRKAPLGRERVEDASASDWRRDALIGEPEGASPVQWQTTDSGLAYLAIQPGTGERPQPSDRVRVHYHGYFPGGSVFDSSLLRGEPEIFRLDDVIPGWREGLQLMDEGAKYKFRIPPHLAYGDNGFPPDIGPGQTLHFDLQLLEILR